MRTPSRVSVVVPLHDHGDVVGETLDSILGQDPEPFEIVVIDDGSSDDGAEVVAEREPHVRLIRQSRQGVATARNRGLAATTGELVVFFDADDLMPPGRLRLQADALDRDGSLDGVFGDVVEFQTAPSPWRGEARPGRLPGSLMLRRAALERAGGFRQESAQVEAVQWAAQADDAGLRIVHLPGVAVERRLHPGNHSRATDHSEYVRVLKRILDRRRESA